MKIDLNDKYQAAITVNWLRLCLEDPLVPDRCNRCPFDDGVHNCIDHLHTTAADLLEKLAGLGNRSKEDKKMSTKEFDQADTEVMGVVNGASEARQDEANAKMAAQAAAAAKAREEADCQEWHRKAMARVAAAKRKRMIRLSVGLAACALAAVLFLMAMLDPVWVPVVGYAGLAACLVAGTIQVEDFRKG